MDKFASMLGEHAGDLVESAVKKALGVEDKDDDDDKKGGFFSIFGDKDKDKEKEKERERDRRKDDDDDKGGFISKFFNKDKDKDDDKEKQFGFHGLFNEKGGADGGDWGQPAAGGQGGFSGGQEGFSGGQGGFGGGQGGFGGGPKGQSKGLNDGDLLDDLMDVAEETAKGK